MMNTAVSIHARLLVSGEDIKCTLSNAEATNSERVKLFNTVNNPKCTRSNNGVDVPAHAKLKTANEALMPLETRGDNGASNRKKFDTVIAELNHANNRRSKSGSILM